MGVGVVRAGGACSTAGSRVSRCAGREVGERTSAGGGIVLSAVVLKVSASLLQAATRMCTRISFRGGGGGGVMIWDQSLRIFLLVPAKWRAVSRFRVPLSLGDE